MKRFFLQHLLRNRLRPRPAPGAARRRFWSLCFLLLLAGAGSLFLFGCGGEKSPAKSETLYTCGMHPQVVRNAPGNCPICGMRLTPIRKPSGNTNSAPSAPNPSAHESSGLALDAITLQNMNLRTGSVVSGPLRRTVRTVGTVDFDESSLTEVTTKFKGWIEKLYADYTGQQLHRGEPLFEVYSPDLYSAQTEYLLAVKGMSGMSSDSTDLLRQSALDKLRYFDISPEQIAELERTRQVKKTLQITAPRDGIVIEKNVIEGQMVDAGMRLYRLADLATVWVQSQVYEQDLPFVQVGQEATVSLSYLPDRKFRGRVTFIYPTVDDKTRTARVRMEFHNPGFFLKPGMFATVDLIGELAPSALLVPDGAILRSGEHNLVFVALGGGRFEPRNVTIGPRAEGDFYQVLAGLSEGEQVVTSGQFLLDSESQLREAIQKMSQPGTASALIGVTSGPAKTEPHAHATANTNAPIQKKIVYICPMPEHVALEYEHAGKCPLCGMNLVPVSQEILAKVQPGGQVQYWTCPMPEHSDVHESKPGRCPRCGMTLIPVMPQAPERAMTPRAKLPPNLYTCPMASHADVVSDRPGVCPKCEMPLVETTKVSHGKLAEEHWHEQHPSESMR